jgi:hypothetical protein
MFFLISAGYDGEKRKLRKKRSAIWKGKMLTRVVISFFETHCLLWAKTFTL